MWCALISAKNSYRLTLSTTSNRSFLLNLMSRCFCMISFHVFRLCSVGAYNVYVLSTFLPWWKSVIGAPCLGPLSRIWLCAVLGAILLLLLLDAVEGAGDEEKSNVPEDFFRCNVQRSGKGGRMTPNSSIGIGFCSGASQSVSQSIQANRYTHSLLNTVMLHCIHHFDFCSDQIMVKQNDLILGWIHACCLSQRALLYNASALVQ